MTKVRLLYCDCYTVYQKMGGVSNDQTL